MKKELEKKFEKLAQDTLASAENIDCKLSEFRDGLQLVHEQIQERIDMVNAELGDDE